MAGTGNSKEDFIPFLQWALPKMRMQWKGFRKVQNQVVKRIRKRLGELAIDDLEEYENYLKRHPFEWTVLDQLCQITVSRFYRDRGIQEKLRSVVLPDLAGRNHSNNQILRIWSAGSAGGEEPYTISLMMHFDILPEFPGLRYSIEGLEINPTLIRRAKCGCYGRGSLKELPDKWLTQAFERTDNEYCIRERFKSNVFFHQGDLRHHMPASPFDLMLCRYLIATYYDVELQKELFKRIVDQISMGGYLILGSNEKLPAQVEGLLPVSTGIYMKSG